ncbi:MAG: nucleotidyltransferase family protein [Verrucomicrobiales bacterium]|jgi:hypothetical protein|nr:nucleotidyltransferase family protein [Verrucomicrobiales bacterium]
MSRPLKISRRLRWPRGCWPNEEQELLLTACLSTDDTESLDAFRAWQNEIPLDYLEGASARLIPLLYQRVSNIDKTTPGLKGLAGIVRYHWVHNQLLNRDTSEVLRLFSTAGIETILLKGVALNATVFADGVRPSRDIDILIRREQIDEAQKLLLDHGWTHSFSQAKEMQRLSHACHLTKESDLDLHWEIFHGRYLTDAQMNRIWDESEPVEVSGAKTRTLCPTDQLIHLCEHGMRHEPFPSFRWIADVHRLLSQRRESIDWERCRRLGSEFGVLHPVHQTLRYLSEFTGAPVSEEGIRMTRCATLSGNRIGHEILQRRPPGNHPFWHTLPSNLLTYRRLRKRYSDVSLSEYLKIVNAIDLPKRELLSYLGGLWIEAKIIGLKERLNALPASFSANPRRTISVATLAEHLLEGYHSVEKYGGSLFRWTFPSSAIRLSLPKEDYLVTLHLFPTRDCRKADLKLQFNQSGLTWKAIDADTVQFSVSASMFVDYPLQRLVISSAAWEEAAADPRKLGLPVIKLRFSGSHSGNRE